MCLISAFVLLAYPKVVFIMRANRVPGPGDSLVMLNLLVELALLVPGIVCGMASWILWRERRSERVPGRGWVIGASLLNIFMFLALSLLYGHVKGANVFWGAQAVGIVGLIVFSLVGGPLWGQLWRRRGLVDPSR
jgi:hypothetical protein